MTEEKQKPNVKVGSNNLFVVYLRDTLGPAHAAPLKRGIKTDSGASMGHPSGRGHGPAPNQSGDKTVARRGDRSSPLHGPGLVPQEEPARGATRGRAGTPA